MERKSKKEPKPCPMTGCYQDIKVGGWCGACYSWISRTTRKTPGQLSEYILRLRRFGGRAEMLPSVAAAADDKRVATRVERAVAKVHRIDEHRSHAA
jgi:transposase